MRPSLAVCLLVLLPALATAQPDPPKYEDLIELKDGRQLSGVIEKETADEITLRVGRKTKTLRKRDVADILYREKAALDFARGERQAGNLDLALATFEKVARTDRDTGRKHGKAADAEVEATLQQIAAVRYQDIIWVEKTRRLFGVIVKENRKTGQLRLRLAHGEIDFPRIKITRILRKEEATLTRADQIAKDGDIESAIGLYRKVHAGERTPDAWKRAAADKLAGAYTGLADDARSRDDLEQAERLLAQVARLKITNPGVQERVEASRKALTELIARRRARAGSLVAEATKLIAREEFRAAYPKLVEAFNLQPDREGLRDLLDRCLSNIQVLAYGDFDDPATLDPVTATKPVELRLGQFMYSSLITRDAEERFVPELANKGGFHVDRKGTTFTFILRRGVRWTDGTELTAHDVEFSLRLLLNPKTHNYSPTFAQFVQSVEVVDPYQLKVVLKRPFYRPLSLFSFKVVPRKPFKTAHIDRTSPFCRNPIGSGPFRYSNGLGTRAIELARNPHFYLKGKPYLSGVRLKQYQDRLSGRNDLERGELHLLTELRPLDVDFFEKNKARWTVQQYRARTIYFFGLNYRRPIFRDTGKGLRRAIASVIDRQAILEQFFNAGNPLKRRGGQAHSIITGPYPYNSWAYNDAVPEYKYDRDYAARLLADTLQPQGWQRDGNPGTYGGKRYWRKDGEELSLRIKYPKGDLNVEKACIFIADDLRRIGIRVRLAKKAPRDLHQEVVGKHDFDIAYWRHTFDDTYDCFPLFDPRRMAPGGSNFCGYVNPALVKLFNAIQRTRNPQRIRALARRIHKVAHDDCAMVFLWQLDQYAAHVNELRNVDVHPYRLFSQVERWKIIKGAR